MLRLFVCLFLSILVAICVAKPDDLLAADFTWPVNGAKVLAAGGNPYLGRITIYDAVGDPLFYPVPALLVAAPFAFFHFDIALSLFAAVSAFCLAYAVTADGSYWRLSIFLSVCSWLAFSSGQWAPLLLAGYYLPMLSALWICKPSLAVGLFLTRPNWYAVVGAIVLLALSFFYFPGWPYWWLLNLRHVHHPFPITWGWFAPVMLLSALAWRLPEARYFLLWSLTPQLPVYYDALPLFLVAKKPYEMFGLILCSWLSVLSMFFLSDIYALTLLWLPALLIVLRRFFVSKWHSSYTPGTQSAGRV